MPFCHASVAILFIRDVDAKMQHAFAYNGLHLGAADACYTFLEISRRADVKL